MYVKLHLSKIKEGKTSTKLDQILKILKKFFLKLRKYSVSTLFCFNANPFFVGIKQQAHYKIRVHFILRYLSGMNR